ncbi:MAG TPA: hypothetical protein VMV49_10565 [Candidatus Deferrimicrobium sp.]|nr:hypothetical protein [Candidatus Deferrimicrobium sp.]
MKLSFISNGWSFFFRFLVSKKEEALNIYNINNIVMAAIKRIPVSEEIWKELSGLKKPGQTFDQLLNEIIEREKKYRLRQEMKKIEAEEEFVELDH